LPSSSLSDMRRLIEHPELLEKTRLPKGTGIDGNEAQPAGCHLESLLWHKRDRFWFARVRMGCLRIQSQGTRCIKTASQWHVSVSTLKILFQAHRDLDEKRPVEESWTAAFAQARAQKIFFPGMNFDFTCELRWKEQGVEYKLETPHVHSFETAMKHRKQILALRHEGRQAMRDLRNKLIAALKRTKRRWQAQMRRKQRLLRGYILCELHNRSFPQTSVHNRRRLTGKQPVMSCFSLTSMHARRRLTGKQPVASCLETTMALSKLAGMMVEGTTTNNNRVQRRVRSFLQSDGAKGLRCLLREAALQYSVPQPAIGDVQTGVHASSSVRKRKLLCITDVS